MIMPKRTDQHLHGESKNGEFPLPVTNLGKILLTERGMPTLGENTQCKGWSRNMKD